MVTNASPIEGSSNLFLQFERIGGIAGLHDSFIVDNNGTASMYVADDLVWRARLSVQKIEKLKSLILDNRLLDQEVRILPKKDSADYFTYHLKVILQTQEGLDSNEVSWVDEWASATELPQYITNFQKELRDFIRGITNPLKEDLELEMSIDKIEVVSGEEVTVTIRLTNVGQDKVAFETGLPVFDLILYDINWRSISRWSDGKAFIMIALKIELPPGESLVERIEWDLSIYNQQTGDYTRCAPGQFFISALFRVKNVETVAIPIRVH
ncbi:MAG: BsuPI-related putative proteinase inhibitor [Thermoproteota archaeon]